MMLPLGLALTLVSAVSPSLGRWAVDQERRILAHGKPLSEELQNFATSLEIVDPASIRVLEINPVPLPLPEPLVKLALRWGVPVFRPGGMSLGRGIYLLPGQDRLLRHELVHTLQYQRLGGIGPFMRRYVMECLVHGYAAAPLEQEARELAH